MKILIINPNSDGGVCQYTQALCQALEKERASFILLTTQGKNELDYFKNDFIIRRELKSPRAFLFFKLWRYWHNRRCILKMVRREKIDVVHFEWLLSQTMDTGLIKKLQRLNILTVYTAHNILPHEARPGDKRKLKKIYQTVEKIIVHAENNKQDLIDNFNIPANKIDVIFHGNFLNVVKLQSELTFLEARRMLGLEQNNFIILFFGNVRPYRGLDVLIKAMVYLRKYSNIKLVIAGKIHDFEITQDLIDLFKVRESTDFHLNYISLDEVHKYFYAADVVVLPYHKIYQSGAIQLAYSFGRPVISTQTGGVPEVIDEDKSGFVIPVDDSKILAKKILTMYQNLDKTKLMGRYSLELAKQKFDWTDIAKKTIQVYQNNLK
ncbi:MAG: glycosyltransferase family 4 protein [Patescibacteria group bacterium]|nr:glycosyltransferase family 4 protein [Patescibacteria group bacterium]